MQKLPRSLGHTQNQRDRERVREREIERKADAQAMRGKKKHSRRAAALNSQTVILSCVCM